MRERERVEKKGEWRRREKKRESGEEEKLGRVFFLSKKTFLSTLLSCVVSFLSRSRAAPEREYDAVTAADTGVSPSSSSREERETREKAPETAKGRRRALIIDGSERLFHSSRRGALRELREVAFAEMGGGYV